MNDFEITLFLWLFATSLLVWRLPQRWQIDGISVSTIAFLALFAPWSCLWLVCGSLSVYGCMHYSAGKRMAVAAAICIFLVFLGYKGLSASENKPLPLPVLAGISYYTCRHIHVLIELYKTSIKKIAFRQYCQYVFFLPVIFAGPIHRYPNFKRQCERRRWDQAHLTGGLERVLYGYTKVVVGNFLLNVKLAMFFQVHTGYGFIDLLVLSVKDWLHLYLQFSGYTDVALGFSMILGFQLEENFNNPLMARNLIDFWQRWHITLSSWCKDYVFAPIQAATRNQLLAVGCAMIVMGIWHEVSLYYFLWGIYHAAGIALCRLYQLNNDPLRLGRLPALLCSTITRTATFSWLVAGKPVIVSILALGKIL